MDRLFEKMVQIEQCLVDIFFHYTKE